MHHSISNQLGNIMVITYTTEERVYFRERAAGLTPWTYLISGDLVEIPVHILVSTLCAAMVYARFVICTSFHI
jgi:hypothetical protein